MVEVDPALLRLKQRYLEAVLTGVGTLAGLTIDEGLRQGFSIVDIYLGILVPTQDELGHAWFSGKVNEAQEHLGSQITLDQMNRLRFQISPRSKLGFRVAVTT